MYTTTPSLQQTLLYQLYRFRFLSQKQLQTLLSYKNHTSISHALHILIYYSFVNTFTPSSSFIPSLYYLTPLGLTHLQTLQVLFGFTPPLAAELKNNAKASKMLIATCQDIVVVSIALSSISKEQTITIHTKTELYGMTPLPTPRPDVYMTVQKREKKDHYFMEVFQENAWKNLIYKRVRQYYDFWENGEWLAQTDTAHPKLLFLTNNPQSIKYLEYVVQEFDEEFAKSCVVRLVSQLGFIALTL
jgi:hypothetical protein